MIGRLAVLFCTLFALVGLQGCFFVSFPLALPTSDYREVLMEEGGTSKILLLDVDGAISSGSTDPSSFFGVTESTVNSVAGKLEKARKDSSVKAVILRVDSPGGGVTASDVIYRMLRDFKAERNVPIYVSMLDTAASGGYYISMAGDEIYAHPTTVTGSIGVIAMFPQLEQLGNKIGVSFEVVKSGPNKDLGSPFHDMSPEHRAILQNTINEMYDRFVQVVLEGRTKMDETQVRRLADGRIYTADQALEAGLIDGVKYLDEVVARARTEPGMAKARVVMYRRTTQEKYDSLYATMPLPERTAQAPAQTNVGLLQVNTGNSLVPRGPVFQYLWTP